MRLFLPMFVGLAAISQTAASQGRTLRQHAEPRALLDICISLDADVFANVDPLGIPASAFVGLDLCLCLSALPLAITTSLDLQTIAKVYGEDLLSSVLEALINTAPNRHHCQYPPHSHSICEHGNPCGFGCEPPYIPYGTQCICPPPYSLCNGICGLFPHGCGSSVPYRNRRSEVHLQERTHGPRTHGDALATCANGEQVCGTSAGSSGFECIDTARALESCGGCVIPNPFLLRSHQGQEGTDCSALPGVSDVSCNAGRCLIRRCKRGFEVTNTSDGCVPEGSIATPQLVTQIRKARSNVQQ
ncbi:hypothetical protein BC834DRAFT_126187 [Gloeopeniophorella convolvens]|nr:hypothetical protein BC834DRAFT_126187 [Gloeopeniophorella convolvens]